jgi:hypothetical protein
MEHLMSNNLIRPSQHSFMPGKSCASNLAVFLDKVTKAVGEGKNVDIFYLDFAKVFDQVPRKRLIAKLQAKGRDPLGKWPTRCNPEVSTTRLLRRPRDAPTSNK